LNPKVWIILGALSGFLSVSLGAFGAHAMKDSATEELFYSGANNKAEFVKLKEYKSRMEIFEVGVRYQMYHSLALVLTGLLGAVIRSERASSPTIAGLCFTVGLVLFCGPLYGMTFLIGFNWLGAIVPIGGVSFLVGWAALGIAAMNLAGSESPAALETAPARQTVPA
jgi:uncharacterized membrane protein YgdD (TMEM256/DUF423 family)